MGRIATVNSLTKIGLVACVGMLSACQGPGLARPEALDIARAQFQRFVDLEGDWRVVGGDHALGASHLYRTVASGSAVVETAFPGDDHEMITVFHLDGPNLVLTHYCAAGNQPHMVAEASEGNEISFLFVSAANLLTPEDGHMHDARFTFLNENRFTTTWSFWEGGQQSGEPMVMEIERIPE